MKRYDYERAYTEYSHREYFRVFDVKNSQETLAECPSVYAAMMIVTSLNNYFEATKAA